MAKLKAKSLPPLTPRAREVVNHVVNKVALSHHDNDDEIGASRLAAPGPWLGQAQATKKPRGHYRYPRGDPARLSLGAA
jgi:hypothetical protein